MTDAASMGPGCFHPRNIIMAARDGYLRVALQWGRDVSIPEIRSHHGAFRARAKLQWGRDVSIPEMRFGCGTKSVTMRLQWGRDVSIPEIGGEWRNHRCTAVASMGPGCFHPRNKDREPHSLGD